MKNYNEKLKDPRWQKRRLEIMSRDNFTCRVCGCGITDGIPLNVHHIAYKRKLEPWDYPNDMLVTLCESCHQKIHEKYGEITKEAVEPFFFTYAKVFEVLLKTDVISTSAKVLYKFISFAEYNTNKVTMTSERVNEIMSTCNISRTSYHRAVNDLLKVNVITKNKNVYTINEKMFWKGDRKKRQEIIISKMNENYISSKDEMEKEEQDD